MTNLFLLRGARHYQVGRYYPSCLPAGPVARCGPPPARSTGRWWWGRPRPAGSWRNSPRSVPSCLQDPACTACRCSRRYASRQRARQPSGPSPFVVNKNEYWCVVSIFCSVCYLAHSVVRICGKSSSRASLPNAKVPRRLMPRLG